MVAVIHQSKSLKNVLNYNEQKLKQGKATCLTAANYPKSVDKLNFYQKLNRLTHQAELNERTKVNAVHISLNFDTTEKIPESMLKKIADSYMGKIGFGKQPYLVYQHKDAGHEHLHIVTTNIKADGKRIELHNLGRNQSEKARKEIEIDFDLVRADSKKLEQAYQVKPVNVQKVVYGKSDTRRAITNVLDGVLNKYRYTSLPELNAVLKQYNVAADRGTDDSRTFQKGGLVYRVLDEAGNKTGVPIKASLIYNNPGLKYLEEKFIENEHLRTPHKRHVKNAIDWILTSNKEELSLQKLGEALKKESVDMVLRENKEGIIYGITYIDHKNRVVFNGSDLGKAYSAKGLLERLQYTPPATKVEPVKQKRQDVKNIKQGSVPHESNRHSGWNSSEPISNTSQRSLLELLTDPNQSPSFVPYELTKDVHRKKRKKKKKR